MSGKWLDTSIKGFLLDITGVCYDSAGNSGIPIEGSIEAIKLLRQAKIPFRFCSNESTASRVHLARKLGEIGFDIKAEEITCPAPVAAQLLRERGLRPFFLVKDEVLEEFEGINSTNANCVVMGDAQENFSYENVNRAFSVLINSPTPILISMGCGRYYKETDGLKIDVGAYCKGLEYACGIKAEFVGKPDPKYFLSALEQLKISPANCVMIGDDVAGDCGAAQKAGMRALLVRTGKYRPEDERRTDVQPDGVVDNLLQAVQAFLDFKNAKAE
ncbi:Phospholysine phosphohistidine inorganic pyrophosphate phosphatase [Hypsibius exemplaris]|uniref:Phospholysine phosphohistidine inorganic pyrophosphate phosphatase n=1 Tax=Hypsibius exemplaris TaxID=2072580 RepID=A0A1W0X1M5_HYPEX|nr:Phospholysine phosphohistidine inorganic pyrophosphate phosphatase [Hypsibius exemplaris]